MENNGRMQWLDAMRGFTMILVVAYHVAQLSFGQNMKMSASLPFLVLFRMPLFFFVSGFLAYKTRWVWTTSSFLSLMWKKIRIQIFPALVFLCVFIVFNSKKHFDVAFMNAMASPFKSGYWFTWVLLQMFFIYYVFAVIAQKTKSQIAIWILLLLSFCAYETLYLDRVLGKWYNNDFMSYSSIINLFRYFPYFVTGNLIHRYWDRVQKLFDSNWFFTIITLIALFSCADIFLWHYMKWEWGILPRTTAVFSLLFIVIIFFRHYEDSFRKETIVGSTLQYIGVRTLDIYLLHYLFLPKLPMVGKWLNTYHPNFVIDIVSSVTLAVVVILFCCFLSNILRISSFFRKYLFGRM